jgi:hypothetical protein
MYSDEWRRDKSISLSRSQKINSSTNIHYWVNTRNELVGVQINFNLADDVHYELQANELYRFLDEVLQVESRDNYIETLREFLQSSPIPQVELGVALYQNGIEYQKMAFYDTDFDDEYEYQEPQEPPQRKMSQEEIKKRLSGRAAEYLMFLDD